MCLCQALGRTGRHWWELGERRESKASLQAAAERRERAKQHQAASKVGSLEEILSPHPTPPRWHPAGSRPRDCFDIYMSGQQEDGIYSIFPTHYPDGFQVYCDMSTDGGGWTVFQRREDGSVNFFRGWEAYRDGFGKLTGEHWLGLKRIHLLTVQGSYELRIDLEDFDNGTAFAHYGSFGVGLFSVDPEEDGYPISIADYSGTAGDSFLKHNGMKFTTKDLDNDHSENNCASFYHGAWWYRNCHTSNLNGQYLRGHHSSYADGIEWSSWTGWQYSLKFTEMKIRPIREEN
uniref:Fibrinogen C-terminal domain-containing protein n=1 Tax=Zonotrichia albicollis TaxID=44394 RepID=A0A8D2NAN4_ZONAL